MRFYSSFLTLLFFLHILQTSRRTLCGMAFPLQEKRGGGNKKACAGWIKPKLAETQIPTMTHSRWGRVEVSAPPRWCSERPREGQEGALSALVSCHHLTPAVGPAEEHRQVGAGPIPPSAPCPLRGPLAGSSTGCHLAGD